MIHEVYALSNCAAPHEYNAFSAHQMRPLFLLPIRIQQYSKMRVREIDVSEYSTYAKLQNDVVALAALPLKIDLTDVPYPSTVWRV